MGSKSRQFVVYYGRNTYYKHFCHCTKMKFSIKDFCSKRDQICNFGRIWSHLLKKSLVWSLLFLLVVCLIYLTFLTEIKMYFEKIVGCKSLGKRTKIVMWKRKSGSGIEPANSKIDRRNLEVLVKWSYTNNCVNGCRNGMCGVWEWSYEYKIFQFC